MTRFFMRPIRKEDFEDFKALAFSVRGMTSLPKDEILLEKKVRNSIFGFDEKVYRPGGETYLFVLEDREKKKIIGVSGIISKVGGFEPYYSYKIQRETLYSEMLKVKREIRVLHLSANHNGPTEICSLALNKDYRGQGLGRLLSLSRFLFIADFRERFDKNVISEMRGVIDEKTGSPPFWEGVGRHFFDTDFFTADHLCSLGRKDFIAELMPKHPLYYDLLTQAAQNVIGEVHRDTKPARKLLEREGFRFLDEIDIFDGGPTMKAVVEDLRTIQFSKRTKLSDIMASIDAQKFLIANCSLNYRCCEDSLKENPDGTVCLAKETAETLELKTGDDLRYVSLK